MVLARNSLIFYKEPKGPAPAAWVSGGHRGGLGQWGSAGASGGMGGTVGTVGGEGCGGIQGAVETQG